MTTALMVTAGWAAALTLLAALWIGTPFSGPGRMFLIWSIPTLALTAFTIRWLRGLALPQVRVTRAKLVLIAALWAIAATAALLLAEAGAELALDGFVLRRPLLHAVGLSFAWIPGLFGLALCVTGLASALEARYRIAHEAGALTPSGP